MDARPGLQILDSGRRAFLLQAPDGPTALGLYRAVSAADLAGLVDAVPAARTVLLTFATPAACELARPIVRALRPEPPPEATEHDVVIPVTYDGADLAEVAELTGLTVAEVIARHTASLFEVAFIGFAPGFAYLAGLDPALHVPRHSSPRTSVPAGSVAIAGPYGAVYPSASPGGWRLLGTTTLATFQIERDPPALLRPGARVRFTAVPR